MSNIYPKHNIKAGTPIDQDRLNENFRELIQEVNGSINETNIAVNSLTYEQNLKADALSRFYKHHEVGRLNCKAAHRPHTIGPDGSKTYQEFLPITAQVDSDGDVTAQPGNIALPLNNSWTTIASLKVTTREGLIWLLGSWQQTYYVDSIDDNYPYYAEEGAWYPASASKGGSISTRDRYRFFPGVQYCLSVDGARVSETTIGGLDVAEDDYGAAYGVWSSPFVTDLILPISAGKHTFTIEARIPKANRAYPEFDPEHSSYTIASRELILLELT